jgi:multidrug efflux system membrane fusion protein
MRFRGLGLFVFFALVEAAGCVVLSPDSVDRWAPAVAPLAHQAHARLFGTQSPIVGLTTNPGHAGPGPAPILVSVSPAKRVDFPLVLKSLGQVQASNTVLVRARVEGQIVKIAFKEGQMVKAGDLLAQIDPRPFQATLDQAVAKKAHDEANLANAKLDLTRYATLAKQNFATQQQLDTQNSLVNQLTASIAADTAAIDAAQVQLDYTTIRAPISGRVGFRLIDEGNLVNAGQQTGIVTIAQLRPISVVFTEPQQYVDRINRELAKGPLQLEVLDEDGAKLATGKLKVSDNRVDPATGTISLKAEFENTDNALWPGLAVTTELTLSVEKDALVVPEVAIQRGEDRLFVYVVDNQNRAAARQVKIANQNAATAVILEGLEEGDPVVTAGQLLLQPGAQVAIDAGSGS